MAPWALFNGYRWSSPMSQHFRFDASRSLTALEQDSTIVAVIEMSQTKWLVAALVPGVECQPLEEFDAEEEMLLKLLHRWRREAGKAGRNIKRIVVAFEAGRAATGSRAAAEPPHQKRPTSSLIAVVQCPAS